MKRRLSVLMLATRSSIYYVLAIFLLMAAAEGGVFYWVVTAKGTDLSLEEMVFKSHISLVFGLAFVLLCICLSLTGAEFFGSKVRYTIQRLAIREKEVVCYWAIYNSICFFAFWIVQLLIMLFLCRHYLELREPSSVGTQSLFVAFYRQQFLHNLLPLEETSRYVRNLLLALSLGVTAACFSFGRRHDKSNPAIAVVAALTLLFFQQAMGNLANDVLLSAAAVVISFTAAYGVWKESGDEN